MAEVSWGAGGFKHNFGVWDSHHLHACICMGVQAVDTRTTKSVCQYPAGAHLERRNIFTHNMHVCDLGQLQGAWM